MEEHFYQREVIRRHCRHIILITITTSFIMLGMFHPFPIERYDRLAQPISIMVHVLGIVGLPLVLTGLDWLVLPQYSYAFAGASMVAGTFAALIFGLSATPGTGNSFGILTLLCVNILFQLIPKIRKLKNRKKRELNPVTVYNIFLPAGLCFRMMNPTPPDIKQAA